MSCVRRCVDEGLGLFIYYEGWKFSGGAQFVFGVIVRDMSHAVASTNS